MNVLSSLGCHYRTHLHLATHTANPLNYPSHEHGPIFKMKPISPSAELAGELAMRRSYHCRTLCEDGAKNK